MKHFSLFFLGIVVLLSCTKTGYSQRINAYTKQTFDGNFSSISGSGTRIISGCDDCGSSFSLPFTFKYDDKVFSGTSVYVSTNGFMTIANNRGSACCSNWLGSSSFYNGFMIMSQDMYVQTGMYYQTTGSAPNRVLTVEWNNTRRYSGNRAATSWQVKLYETSGSIEYIFKDHSYNMGGSSNIGTGLNGTNTPNFIYVTHSSSQTGTPASDIRWITIPDRQIAVTPESIDFGYEDGGTVVTQTVTVQSVGTAPDPVDITNVVISTGNPDFTILSNPPSSLQPGESATFEVQWRAQGAGPRSAILLVQSTGRDSGDQQVLLNGYTRSSVIQLSVSQLFNKKRVLLGKTTEEDILVKNIGEAPLVFTNPNAFEFIGEDSTMYSITRLPMDPLPPGEEDTLRVAFAPTVEGGHTAQLLIHNNSSNNAEALVKLKGTGVLPHIVVTPDPMQFDSVEIGTTVTQKFTIYNPGSDTLKILNNEFTTADADFTLVPLVGDQTIIPPDHSREVAVTFTPKQRGTRVARYHVVTNIPLTFEIPNRDTATTSLYYDIEGTGVPVGSLITSIDNGGFVDSSLIGVAKCQDITLTNLGDADITLTDATFSGSSAGDYSISGLSYPYILHAKSSVTVHLCGTPSARGSRASELTITGTSNDKPSSLTISPIDVKGLLACDQAAPLVAFSTALIPHFATDTETVVVTNCGDVPAVYSAALTVNTDSSYSISPATSAEIAPGGTAAFEVLFTPTSSGLKAGTLTITAPNVTPINVDLQGTGACAILSTQATVAAPTTPAGSTQQFTVTIGNTGNLAWDPGTPVLTPADAFSYVSGVTSIPAGGSADLTFAFAPPSWNEFTTDVTFPDAKECGNPVTIKLTGSASAGAVDEMRSPEGVTLSQNAPNPVTSGITSFNYTTPRSMLVKITLTDITGKVIRTLVSGTMPAGTYRVDLNTGNLESGTYFYILESGDSHLVRKTTVSK